MLAVTGLVLTVAWVARVLMIIRIVGRFYGPAIEVEVIIHDGEGNAAPRDAITETAQRDSAPTQRGNSTPAERGEATPASKSGLSATPPSAQGL